MREEAAPVDTAERERISRSGLAENLFVEAGAGTGKTSSLVARIAHLVLDDTIPLREIAAITFTEAAAAELRDRIRESLERLLAGELDDPQRALVEAALADTDIAAIGTLHSFALRILSEHPVEAGLPPRVEILDEVSSQLAFETRWTRFVDDLHQDPGARPLVVRAHALGVPVESAHGRASLKDVAAILGGSWDRLAAEPEPLEALGPIDLGPLARAAAAVRSRCDDCNDPSDRLLERITNEVLPQVDAVLAEPEELRRLTMLHDYHSGWKSSGRGREASWSCGKAVAQESVDVLGAAAAKILSAATDEVLRHLTDRLARFTREAADERRADGRLEFHDLLVLARHLVRTSGEARALLHRRYRRLLLDEFQDTDPLQIEIAVLIAGATGTGTVEDHWSEIPTDVGGLFFVGDPKQSIYRFRRADIALFLAARAAFANATPVRLRQNFRTVEPVLEWVNHVFGALMAEEVPAAQPRYEPLVAARTDAPGTHEVVLLGGAREARAGELRDAEAGEVAAAVAGICDDPDAWPVFDRTEGQWRPARPSDVTVLIPTRTSLPNLQDAFDEVEVPYRVDTGTLVYDTQEVHEVLATLRAIDDPDDALALVAALRSPLYACSDVDLFTFHHAGGQFDLRRQPPESVPADHPVTRALAHLRSLWDARWWNEPSALLDRLLAERKAFELGFGHRRPREVWRRLRFLLDQARAFQEAGGGNLRAFLGWAELQRSEGSRVHEPLLPETDDASVSIMTIHGAKGLEFPITVVAGLTTEARHGRRGVQVLWPDGIGRPEVRLTKAVATANFDRTGDLEAEMDGYERIRLLYVACTRARDHLIVSTVHAPGKDSFGEVLARHSAGVADTLCRRLPGRGPAPAGQTVAIGVPPSPSTDDRGAWIAARQTLLDGQREPRFVSATAVARLADRTPTASVPGAAERSVLTGSEEEAVTALPWRRGRAGTAIGRAVHATLQLVDLATGDGIDELAFQQAHLEAVPEAAATIAGMARAALASPAVQAARAAPRMWRELYVAAPIGERAIEGYVDLLYEDDRGLIVVDYKTDTLRSPADADAKTDHYRLQTAAYAVALEIVTGMPVIEARLVFCTTTGAIERTVPDLAAARAEVQTAVTTRV